MAFHPDATTCRRIPPEFLETFRAQPVRRDAGVAAKSTRDEPTARKTRPEEPSPLPSHWVDMLHGDSSLDDLFR